MSRISVIVPVYKVENYLERCVRSIMAQTYRDLEIILVDDGSPDNCGQICDALAAEDSRIKVIHKENGGLSDARNVGLAAAAGELIGFVDSDDHIDPTMYEKLLETMQNADADVSLCGFQYIDEQTGAVNQEMADLCPLKDGVLSREEALSALDLSDWGYHFYVTAWNKLYKRHVLGTNPFPVGKLHEDEFAVHHIFARCQKVAVLAQPMYRYMQRRGSIMSAGTNVRTLDVLDAYYDRYELYEAEQMKKEAVSILAGSGWKMVKLLQTLPAAAKTRVWEILKRLIPHLIRYRKPIGAYLLLPWIRFLLRTGRENKIADEHTRRNL